LIDQESPVLGLSQDYRDFRCNYNSHEPGFVMYKNLHWKEIDYSNPEQAPVYPTLDDLSFDGSGVEVFLSKEPLVQILNFMDFENFDVSSRNYYLESTIMYFLTLVCFLVMISLLAANLFKAPPLSEEQKQQIEDLEMQDVRLIKLREKR